MYAPFQRALNVTGHSLVIFATLVIILYLLLCNFLSSKRAVTCISTFSDVFERVEVLIFNCVMSSCTVFNRIFYSLTRALNIVQFHVSLVGFVRFILFCHLLHIPCDNTYILSTYAYEWVSNGILEWSIVQIRSKNLTFVRDIITSILFSLGVNCMTLLEHRVFFFVVNYCTHFTILIYFVLLDVFICTFPIRSLI